MSAMVVKTYRWCWLRYVMTCLLVWQKGKWVRR